MEYASLVISVDSRQVKTADRELATLERTGDAATSSMTRLAAAVGTVFATDKVLDYAEAWTTISNRLRLVTDSQEELVRTQEAIFRIAQESRQPLSETAELYQRMATNADALGLSGSDVARIVETINKSLAVSGTAGAGAQAALIQLGQAFASGTLRGEELNAVLEQAPALARALADGLGVTVGQLRTLGADGKLAAETVAQALLSQSGAMDAQFAKTQATVTQSMTVVGNSLTQLIGRLDQSSGASQAFAGALQEFAQWLDTGGLDDNLSTIVQILETGLYVAMARGVVASGQYVAQLTREIAVRQAAAIAATEQAAAERALAAAQAQSGLISQAAAAERIAAANATIAANARAAAGGIGMMAGAGSRLLGIMGGPVGLAAMVAAAGFSLADFQGFTKGTKQDVESLTDSMDGATASAKRFKSAFGDGFFAGDKADDVQVLEKRLQYAQNLLKRAQADFKRGMVSVDFVTVREADVARLEASLKRLKSALAEQEKPEKKASVGRADPVVQEVESRYKLINEMLEAGNEAYKRQVEEQRQADESLVMGIRGQNATIRQVYEERQQIIDGLYQRRRISEAEYFEWSQRNTADRLRAEYEQELNQKQTILQLNEQFMSQAMGLAVNLQSFMEAIGHENNALAKAAFAVQKGIAVAQAIVQAEMASVATRLAYAQWAAFAPPATQPAILAAGETMAQWVRGMGYASAALMAGTAIAGGRALGGQVLQGQTYLVGERGPELLTMGGNGHVTSNDRLKGMGGGPVTIINQTSGRIDRVEERRGAGGERVLIIQEAVNAVAAQMRDPNSPVSRSMQGGFNVTRKR